MVACNASAQYSPSCAVGAKADATKTFIFFDADSPSVVSVARRFLVPGREWVRARSDTGSHRDSPFFAFADWDVVSAVREAWDG